MDIRNILFNKQNKLDQTIISLNTIDILQSEISLLVLSGYAVEARKDQSYERSFSVIS